MNPTQQTDGRDLVRATQPPPVTPTQSTPQRNVLPVMEITNTQQKPIRFFQESSPPPHKAATYLSVTESAAKTDHRPGPLRPGSLGQMPPPEPMPQLLPQIKYTIPSQQVSPRSDNTNPPQMTVQYHMQKSHAQSAITNDNLRKAINQLYLAGLSMPDPTQFDQQSKNTIVYMADANTDPQQKPDNPPQRQIEWTPEKEQEYADAQRTTAKQRQDAVLDPAEGVAEEEKLPASRFQIMANNPFFSETGYSDCLLFAIVQHMTGYYEPDDAYNALLVGELRLMLVQQGWLGAPGGFGANGYMAPGSASTKQLLAAVNEKLKSKGLPPLRVIFHDFAPQDDGPAKEFLHAAGAEPGVGDVVHIINAEGQHYEALIPHKMKRMATQLTLSEQQKIAINRAKIHFASTISAICEFPVILQIVNKADEVFIAGIGMGNLSEDEVRDAVVLKPQDAHIGISVRIAGTEISCATVPGDQLASLLEKIPPLMLVMYEAGAICAMFDPETYNDILLGPASYESLFKATAVNLYQAKKVGKEIETRFNSLTRRWITERGFFQAAKIHSQRNPTGFSKIMPLIIDIFKLSATEVLEKIYASGSGNFRRETCDIPSTCARLYYLAKFIADNEIPSLEKELREILSALDHQQQSVTPKELFKEIRKFICSELKEKPNHKDARKTIFFYYNRFIGALKKSGLSEQKQYYAAEALLPLTVLTELPEIFIQKTLSDLITNFNRIVYGSVSSSKITLPQGTTDSLLSMFITNSYTLPTDWSEYITTFYYKIINKLGENGTLPFSCIELIEFTNMMVSPERAKVISANLIGRNIKTNINKIKAITAIMIRTMGSEEIANAIYSVAGDEKAIKAFVNKWLQYQNILLTHPTILPGDFLIQSQDEMRVIKEGDINSTLTYALNHIEVKRTLEKYKNIEEMVFTGEEYAPILGEILHSIPPVQKTEIINRIVNLNVQTGIKNQEIIINLVTRLQKIIDSKRNALKSQKDHTLWNKLLSNVSSIQAELMKYCTESHVTYSLQNNLAEIDDSNEIIQPLVRLNKWLKVSSTENAAVRTAKKNITDNRKELKVKNIIYLEIIAQAVKKSYATWQTKKGEEVRAKILKTALGSIAPEELFPRLAELTLKNSKLSGYKVFSDIVSRQMQLTPDSANASTSKTPDLLNEKQLQAFTTFITSSPAAWGIFEDAYKSPGKIEWIMKPESFFNVSAEVQALMLRFISDKFSTETVVWIKRYLEKIEGMLTLPQDNITIINLENSLSLICNGIKKINHQDLPELVSRIFILSNSIMLRKVKPTISISLNKSLHSILENLETTSAEIHKKLTGDYKTLLLPDQSVVQEFRFVPDRYEPRPRVSVESDTDFAPDSVDAEQRPDKGQKTPPVTTRTIYVDKKWERYSTEKDLMQPLQKSISLLATGKNDHELNVHKYAGRAFSFDIYLGKGGRGNCRGLILIGSKKHCYLIKIGTHKEIESEAQNYKDMEKNPLI
ncbi:hypothetical protein N5923_05295 [Erwiniaceae bacterium BAC15a-03b]|uniref:Uncharacterized protein n=1 Tax=Winslowiella arboricola TaxID=2978220 RepID=A0A9J6PHT4_9GAMM|nr:hypothetical protein [Winslowiella arboricola]MCU5774153.1 hypothetical protein [Winslowiella arboricola]MCU5776914.1 hypothetical protein [Winslowiella arboricola]